MTRTGREARLALGRAARRAAAGGFTLIELMIVVLMISILALIATPAMGVARDDRLAFDYARRIEQLIHRGRARSFGRGAAHLFVASPSGASRGRFLLFEALDGVLPAAGGPNPVRTCMGAGEWADVVAFVPGAVSNTARVIDGFNLDSPGSNVTADIQTAFSVNGAAAATVVMCVGPGGATFVGTGATIALAITDMQTRTTPFNSFMEIQVTRKVNGAAAGLTRRVLVAGGAAPRIKSE